MRILSLTKVRSVHNVHSQNKQTENHICVTKQSEGKRKLHTHCKLLSVIPWRNYETFNTQTCQNLGVYPEYIDYMYVRMRTVNLVFAKNVKTKLVSSSSIFLILCYSSTVRWPLLLALNATPYKLHSQIRAREPHRSRNVAESARTRSVSFCLRLR